LWSFKDLLKVPCPSFFTKLNLSEIFMASKGWGSTKEKKYMKGKRSLSSFKSNYYKLQNILIKIIIIDIPNDFSYII